MVIALSKTELIVERHGLIRVLTLNRPEAHNSITASLYEQLLQQLREAAEDVDTRVVVTRASGKSFCVGADGGDLERFASLGLHGSWAESFAGRIGLTPEDERLYGDCGIGAWVMAISEFQKPWIASIGGATAGGGLGLAALHHFRVASTNAKFTTAFGRLGLGPEMGLSATLPALVGSQIAMEMLCTSRLVDAEEAARTGLVDRLVSPENLEAETLSFARSLAEQSPLAIRAVLASQRREWREKLLEKLRSEWADQAPLFASEDFKEGIAAFKARRAPRFMGR